MVGQSIDSGRADWPAHCSGRAPGDGAGHGRHESDGSISYESRDRDFRESRFVAHAHAHDALRKLEHIDDGDRLHSGYPANRASRRRQTLLPEWAHGVSRTSCRLTRSIRDGADAQPRTGHHHGPALSLLFQTGETAYGIALVDAQHPHNFIMGLGFHYARS